MLFLDHAAVPTERSSREAGSSGVEQRHVHRGDPPGVGDCLDRGNALLHDGQAQHDAQPQGVANAVDVAEAVVAAYSHDASSRGVDLELVDTPERVRVGVDQDIAERILHPVVENALRYGRGKVQVRVTRNGSSVLFAVDDDGPGVHADEHEVIFEPAVRGSAGHSTYNGAGLGLALSRRLARAVSGDVEAFPGASGHFVVRLPAA